MWKLLELLVPKDPPPPLEPSQEREETVAFLMCEAFEHRYSPEIADALRAAAQDIRRGRHLRPGHEPLPDE